jgi:predicted RNase H-like HicB family nuclease
MNYYIGIIDGKPGAFGVRIPDCPGAFGAGKTLEDAVANAIVGLAAWAEGALKDGDILPAPRDILEIVESGDDAPDVMAGEVIAMVPLLLDAGRTVKANVTFDAGLLEAIDSEAQRRGLTRSAFLASAAREKITAHR